MRVRAEAHLQGYCRQIRSGPVPGIRVFSPMQPLWQQARSTCALTSYKINARVTWRCLHYFFAGTVPGRLSHTGQYGRSLLGSTRISSRIDFIGLAIADSAPAFTGKNMWPLSQMPGRIALIFMGQGARRSQPVIRAYSGRSDWVACQRS